MKYYRVGSQTIAVMILFAAVMDRVSAENDSAASISQRIESLKAEASVRLDTIAKSLEDLKIAADQKTGEEKGKAMEMVESLGRDWNNLVNEVSALDPGRPQGWVKVRENITSKMDLLDSKISAQSQDLELKQSPNFK